MIAPVVRVTQFAKLRRWDVKHVLESRWQRPPSEMRPLGQALIRKQEPTDDATVRYGSIHFDGRVTLRSPETKMKAKTFFAHEDDLVFSKIDVRNGAIGIVPKELAPIAFTVEYPIYDLITPGILEPTFAKLLCKTTAFLGEVEAQAVGHSGRKRVTSEVFENIKVPIPSRGEQLEIVHEYHRGMSEAEVEEAKGPAVLREAVAEIVRILAIRSPDVEPVTIPFVVSFGSLDKWSVSAATSAVRGISDELQSSYEIRQLGDPRLATVSYGIQKSPRNRPDENSRPYLRVANVQDGYLDLEEVKYIDVPDKRMNIFKLQVGDIVLCEGNSSALVGRPAIWRGELEDCVHQNHVLRVRTTEHLLPDYLLAYMQTSASRRHFRRRAKQTTNLATINATDVRELPVPFPPMDVQEAVAATWLNAVEAAQGFRERGARIRRHCLVGAEAQIVGRS